MIISGYNVEKIIILHRFQRYEFYNVILLGSSISRKTLAKFIDINMQKSLAVHVYSTLNFWELLRQNVQMRPFLAS